MAKLSTAQRKSLSKSQFALPPKKSGPNQTPSTQKGRFPIPDESHARNALARAAQGLKEHTLSPAQAAEIRRHVHAKYPDIQMSSGGSSKTGK